jgi:hypothetical protein
MSGFTQPNENWPIHNRGGSLSKRTDVDATQDGSFGSTEAK